MIYSAPEFDKLNLTMLGYFRRPEEVSTKDRADYANFQRTKTYFTAQSKLLDSVQGRGPFYFLPTCQVN